MNDKLTIQAIESALKDGEEAFRSNKISALQNKHKSIIKNFLIAEFYFKKTVSANSDEFVFKIMSRYYQKWTVYPPKFTDEFGQDIYFAIEYNDKAIDAAETLATYVKKIFDSNVFKGGNDKAILQYLKHNCQYQERGTDPVLFRMKGIHADEAVHLATILHDFLDNIVSMSEIQGGKNTVITELKESILAEITTFINSRKSPTRGMEAGSPMPYVKGTLAAICFGLNICDDLICYTDRQAWKSVHLKGEPEPPKNRLDENIRNILNSVGTVAGILINNGCPPSNYR